MQGHHRSPFYLRARPAGFVSGGPGVEYAGANELGFLDYAIPREDEHLGFLDYADPEEEDEDEDEDEDEMGWAALVAAAVPALVTAIPLAYKGIAAAAAKAKAAKAAKAKKKKKKKRPPAPRPAARLPGPTAQPAELAYLQAVAARDPSRFADALRQMAAVPPSPATPQVGASMYGNEPELIYGNDGQLYEVMSGHRRPPPPPAVDVDVDINWPAFMRQFMPPRAPMPGVHRHPHPHRPPPFMAPPRRPPPPRRRRPAPLPPLLRAAIIRHARIPGHAGMMIAIIRGHDGRPKVGIEDEYGIEDIGIDLEDVLMGLDFGEEDFGEEDFGEDVGDDYGRAGDRMAPREVMAFLKMVKQAQRQQRRIEFRSFGVPNRELRGNANMPTGRSPAPTGQLTKIPLYTSVTGVSPRHSLLVPGGSSTAVVNTSTLTTRAYNYWRLRIIGLESSFGDRSSGSVVCFRYLRVIGADINLIANDSAAWSDADDWSGDIETSPGLRTGEGSIIEKNGVANLEIGIAGDDGDTAVGTVKLICEILSDVVNSQRNTPVGG